MNPILIRLMRSNMQERQKKTMSSHTARILAAVFLCAGILLGFFDAPQYLDKALERIGWDKVSGFKFQGSDFSFPYRLGLDIQGGTHLVYRADMKNISTPDRS